MARRIIDKIVSDHFLAADRKPAIVPVCKTTTNVYAVDPRGDGSTLFFDYLHQARNYAKTGDSRGALNR